MDEFDTLRTVIEFFTSTSPGRLFSIAAVIVWLVPWAAMWLFYRMTRANDKTQNTVTEGLMGFAGKVQQGSVAAMKAMADSVDRLSKTTEANATVSLRLNQNMLAVQLGLGKVLTSTENAREAAHLANINTAISNLKLDDLIERLNRIIEETPKEREAILRRMEELCDKARSGKDKPESDNVVVLPKIEDAG